MQYVQQPTEEAFDLKSIPVATVNEDKKTTSNGNIDGSSSRSTPVATSSNNRLPPTATRQDVYIEKLNAIPQFASFGPLFKSSSPVELTESETEYVVSCVKHVYANHIVLQVTLTSFHFITFNLPASNHSFDFDLCYFAHASSTATTL